MLIVLCCLSPLLTNCGGGKFNVLVPPTLPPIPEDIKQCIAKHVNLPRGDWTVKMVADIVAKYRRREIELEDCLQRVELFYTDLQRGLAKP